MLILLSVCLLASPEVCREERVNWSFETTSYMGCFTHSQQAIAQWSTEHPQWRVAKWRCLARDLVPNDI